MSTNTEKYTASVFSTDDAQIPCVICDRPTKISLSKWSKAKQPCGICVDCKEEVPLQVIYQTYNIRSQFSEMKKQIDNLTARIEGLHQDIEDILNR